MKKNKILFSVYILLFFLFFFISINKKTLATGMESANGDYVIEFDSVNFGGTDQSQDSGGNFFLDDTLGEIATGPSSSTSYSMQAGYRQVFDDEWSLSLFIRDENDLNDTNTCDLGTLSINTVKQCSYRLKIGSTFPSGYQAFVKADTPLENISSENIDFISESSGTGNNIGVSIGQEEYGIKFDSPTNSGPSGTCTVWTKPDPFDDYDSPISTISEEKFIYTNGTHIVDYEDTGDLDGTTLVTHSASISGLTPSGMYSHTITYIVTTPL